VLVNGVVVIDHGRHTGARPGTVIYGPGRRIAQQQADAAGRASGKQQSPATR
jgi:hypothetical protein